MTETLSRAEAQTLSANQVLLASSEILWGFGIATNPFEDPKAFVAATKEVNPLYIGGKKPRQELVHDTTEWGSMEDAIMRAADTMGMKSGETPLVGDFDALIILGANSNAIADRNRYAIDAIKNGSVTVRQVVFAGSSRKLTAKEIEDTSIYAPGAKTEYDLCVAEAKKFELELPDIEHSSEFIDDEKASAISCLERTLSTLRTEEKLPYGASIATVTTQIYRASTVLDLNLVARKFGLLKTHVAGNPSIPEKISERTPATYLSEIMRALRAATNEFEAINA
jgi:hypothetical protein